MKRLRILATFVIAIVMNSSYGALTPGDMSLAMFKSGLVNEPTVFKVKVSVLPWNRDGVWEGSPLNEARDQFWALRVLPVAQRQEAGDSGIICYAKKTSEAGKVIEQSLRDGAFHIAHIQLRYSDKEGYQKCCVVDAIEPLVQSGAGDIIVKFGSTRIGVTKNEKFDYLQGKVSVSYRTKLKFFKKPILRVVLLTDENGSRVIRDSIIDEPDVKMVSSSDSIERNTTTAGNENNEPPFWHHYIEDISQNQSEVSADRYKNVTYEGLPLGTYKRLALKGLKTIHVFGYCKFDKDENAKMIGYRIEAWYNGSCIGKYDTIRSSDLTRHALPEDWHISFKYPEKFKYRSPFACKHVVRE